MTQTWVLTHRNGSLTWIELLGVYSSFESWTRTPMEWVTL